MKKTFVVLGAGYSGLMTAIKLEEKTKSLSEVEIVLVDQNDYHQYIHLTYEIVTGVKKTSDITIPISELLSNRKIRFLQATVTEIDFPRKVVKTSKGDVSYDAVVVALGSEPNFYGVKGAEEFSLCLTSVESAVKIRNALLKISSEDKNSNVVVGGGGFTGVELAGEIADEFRCCVTVVEGENMLLPLCGNPEVSQKAAAVITAMGAKLVLGRFIAEVKPDCVILSDGSQIESSLFVWTAGVQGSSVLTLSGLKTGKGNRAVINRFCEAVDYPGVFVIGDSSLVVDPETGEVLPQCIELALQQSEVVAKNLLADAAGTERTVYNPRFNGLILAVGEKYGIGKVFGVTVEGRVAQMLKRLIHLQYVFEVAGLKEVVRETM
jgi:NADH dehydrogenase